MRDILLLALQILILILIQAKIGHQVGYIQFRDLEISTKSNQLKSGKCCGNDPLCHTPCKIYFRVCLPIYRNYDGVCILRYDKRKRITETNFDLMFSNTYNGQMSLVLRGMDLNSPRPDNLVFEARGKNLLQFVNATWENITQKTNNAEINFRYRLSCNKDWYGPDCELYCKARDDLMGHFTCNYLGKMVCNRGWTGEDCNIAIDKDSCILKPCLHNGKCQNDGNCICVKGFTGNYCEIKNRSIRSASTHNPISTEKSVTATKTFSSSSSFSTGFYITYLGSSFSSSPSVSFSFSSLTKSISQHNTYSLKFPSSSLKPSTSKIFSSLTFSEKSKYIKERSTIASSASSNQQSATNAQESSFTQELNISKLISSTKWVLIPSSSVLAAPSISIETTKKPNAFMITAIIIASLILLTVTFIIFGLLWKRSKYRRRRSHTSTIVPPRRKTGFMNTLRKKSSLSSVRSVTPIISHLYDDSRTGCYNDSETGLDPPDMDTISVIDYPVSDEKPKTIDLEKYTIQAVDRMCYEVLSGGGSTRRKLKTKQNVKRNKQSENKVIKTLSNASSHRSQGSSGYDSSGYCSSGTSSTPSSAATTRSYVSEERFSSNTNFISKMFDTKIEDNNNTANKDVELISRDSSNSDLSHTKQLFKHVKYEGLPNFICYQVEEDEKI